MNCQRCKAHTGTYMTARLAVKDIHGDAWLRPSFSDLTYLCPDCVAELYTWLQTGPAHQGEALGKLEVPGE